MNRLEESLPTVFGRADCIAVVHFVARCYPWDDDRRTHNAAVAILRLAHIQRLLGTDSGAGFFHTFHTALPRICPRSGGTSSTPSM